MDGWMDGCSWPILPNVCLAVTESFMQVVAIGKQLSGFHNDAIDKAAWGGVAARGLFIQKASTVTMRTERYDVKKDMWDMEYG